MSKTNTNSDKNFTCNLKFRQKLRIYLATKSSGCFWFFIDNISCKLDGLAEIYARAIDDEYVKEYTIINILDSRENNIIHIGCGSYPLTDITLAQTSCVRQIVGIDNDSKAVRLAQEVINKKKLDKCIKIEHADGREYPLKKFDIIIVSSCSWPKIEILEHIFKTAKKRSKIIVRELDHAVEPILRCINSHKEIVLKKRMYHHPFPFLEPFGWQTFYLRKK